MKTDRNRFLQPAAVALAVLLAAGTGALPAAAAGKADTDTLTLTQYSDWGDPAMARIAVDSGRALINHLMTARALLDDGDVAQARSALLAGSEFSGAIERITPYLTVVEELQDAGNRLVQERVEVLSQDLLPVYADIDALTAYAPEVAKTTRGLLKQAEQHARNGDREQAAKVLQEAATEVSAHTVYLPVGYVEQQIRVAQSALNQAKPDVAAARAAVERSLDSLHLVVDTVIQTAALN